MTYTRIKNRKFHFIYKTTCLVTDRYYIGMHSTDDLDDGYLGSGKRLSYSIRKHGRENHQREILEYCPDRQSLAKREAEIIDSVLLEDKQCMNLAFGGSGGNIGDCNRSQSSKTRWKNPVYREKMTKMFSARKKSAEEIAKFSASMKKAWENEALRAQISQSNKNYVWMAHPELKTQRVKLDEIEVMVQQGWIRGRKYKS